MGYLAPDAPEGPEQSEAIDVGDLLLRLAERNAAVGENALALRCLDAAAQVRGALPPDAAARRDELAGARGGWSPLVTAAAPQQRTRPIARGVGAWR